MKQSDPPREIELKLRLAPGSRALLESSSLFAGTPGRDVHQVTTYFDTPDRALDRAGLTLRVRQIGAKRIQTVKSRPNNQGVATNRKEWEWRITRDTPDISLLGKTPALAAAALTVRGKLERLFVTDIRRTVRLLHLDGMTIVEAAIDEGTIEAGRKREAVSELELELKAGPVAPIYLIAANMQALVPLWISPESKASRGWYLLTGHMQTAQLPPLRKLSRDIVAAQGLQDILAGSLGHLIANISPTLRGRTEGLHQMRVALRATRAALQLFQKNLSAPTVAKYEAQLQRFAQIFGAARDWDVLCVQTLPTAFAELGTKQLPKLQAAADIQRKAALASVQDVIQGQEFTAVVLSLAYWAQVGATQPKRLGSARMGRRLLALAPTMLDRVNHRVRRRARHAGRLSGKKLHSLRKSLKKLCFDVETLYGLFPGHAVKKYCDRCERILKILGLINDAVVTRRLTRSLLNGSRSDLTISAAAIASWSKHQDRAARHGLRRALRAFKAEPSFWAQ